jgi:hypothetical protein
LTRAWCADVETEDFDEAAVATARESVTTTRKKGRFEPATQTNGYHLTLLILSEASRP